MNRSRRMLASAAVVGVIVVGGVSVAAAASAGRLQQVGEETGAVLEKASPSGGPLTDQMTELTSSPEPSDGFVVSKEVNPDPDAAGDYWTEDRMEDAEPMPMPEVKPGEIVIGD
ncbi:hypothetical protein [Nonomuraea cavernae]|uniref:Uncharacterized protein n=1 Tax=Nonomuraea cavernae TaxID=2045107 RepID=A0A918DGS8_9ACTN|nr:hypothetical protein [Nonomuraea cavernae]MCA2184494.1 hypothetical protein [Nonomuraea cavernae]GGO63620.1 hypothetical protein GCM10012289_11110 [Nonomuraea cavernae]